MAKNKRLSAFDQLIDDLRGKHSKRMNALLTTLDDDEFLIAYNKLLEYAKPKLQRQEITASVDVTEITIERVTIPKDELKKDE